MERRVSTHTIAITVQTKIISVTLFFKSTVAPPSIRVFTMFRLPYSIAMVRAVPFPSYCNHRECKVMYTDTCIVVT